MDDAEARKLLTHIEAALDDLSATFKTVSLPPEPRRLTKMRYDLLAKVFATLELELGPSGSTWSDNARTPAAPKKSSP